MCRLAILAAIVLIPHALRAQSAAALITQARQAFENLEFEEAARLYTRVLDVASSPTPAERANAQLYLGISYEFAKQRANAISAFRALVRSSPCTPSPEQFGADVTAAFLESRASVFAAAPCDVQRDTIAPGGTATFRVAATQPAIVRTILRDSAGQTIADLGEQQVAGIVEMRWNALPSPAALARGPVRYELVVRARAQQGAETDERVLSLLLSTPSVDTAAHPATLSDSLFRPERRSAGPALADLAKGLTVAAALAGSSAALADKSLKGQSTKALAVGGAISLTSVVGFVAGNGKRDIPKNREWNTMLRRRWEATLDSVVTSNAERLRSRRVILEPSPEGR